MLMVAKALMLALCSLAVQLESWDAYNAYVDCLQNAQGGEAYEACYWEMVLAVSEASVDFASCVL